MALESEQAVLPRVNPLQKGQVLPPEPLISASGAVQNIYDATRNPPLQELHLQNCGQTAVKVAINAEATAAVWNFVLKACTANDDGTGGEKSIDMSLGVRTVSVFSAAGSYRISSTKVVNSSAPGRY